MSNTATINSPDGITISRIKPTILSGHMSDIQWNTFCEDIDRALTPASELKKLSKWMMMIRMFSWLFFGVLIVLMLLSWSSDNVKLSGTWYWILIIAMIVIEFSAQCYIAKLFQSASRKVKSGLGEVCNRYSVSNPGLEFKVLEIDYSEQLRAGRYRLLFKARGDPQRDYIEITVTSTAGNTVEPPMAVATSISNPTEPPISQAFAVTTEPSPSNDLEMGSNFSTNKTPITTRREQRMAELDAMKDRISEDEYYAKRAEILSDV